ncbi:unnamed protein product [Paramecium sonneborni]|uniref:Transmembrane protein n=1 Tax=Paramecium sonneborni TaxID=65129 RepID=A0A8S1Q8I2_9CILI|nr:unnamed protein product [Paramecium sonneborni]
MQINNIIDFVDGLLSLFQIIVDIQRLDINISIGMTCRIIFFVVAIVFRDMRTYSIGEFIAQIVAWFIFHFYIIYYERIYFDKGESKTLEREKRFKLMDTLQLGIGTAYLAFNFDSLLELLALIFFSINVGFNIIELILIYCKNNHVPNYEKQGGYCQLMIGLLLGIFGVIFFLIYSATIYWDDISNQELFPHVLIITIIGEIMAFLLFAYLLCEHNAEFVWTQDWTKGILGILYGITVGLFSIFYGFLIGLIVVLYLSYQICKAYHKYQQEQKNNPQAVSTQEN